MAILGTKTFADRLSSTKSVFQKALEDARKLRYDMVVEVQRKTELIETINAEIADINTVSSETDRFITNLEGLV